MRLVAGSRLGPYEILSALGAGGMGEVFRARDTRLGRDVAVKILPERLADNERRSSGPSAGSVTAERASGSASEFSRYRLTLGNRRFALFEGDNVLGRDPDATVVIDHGSVYLRHARITVEDRRRSSRTFRAATEPFSKEFRLSHPRRSMTATPSRWARSS